MFVPHSPHPLAPEGRAASTNCGAMAEELVSVASNHATELYVPWPVDPIYSFIDDLGKALLCNLVTSCCSRQYGHSINLKSENDFLPTCKTKNVVTINCELSLPHLMIINVLFRLDIPQAPLWGLQPHFWTKKLSDNLYSLPVLPPHHESPSL